MDARRAGRLRLSETKIKIFFPEPDVTDEKLLRQKSKRN
jgi:hypothetical protein